MEFDAKGVPKWNKIDAESYQTSMPKLVTEKIRKIIQNHVSLNRKIIEFHAKNNGFWFFRRLHVRTGKVLKQHQKWDQHHFKINEKSIQKSCSEKGYPKDGKSSKKWSKKEVKIEQKLAPNKKRKQIRKQDEKKAIGPERGRAAGAREH